LLAISKKPNYVQFSEKPDMILYMALGGALAAYYMRCPLPPRGGCTMESIWLVIAQQPKSAHASGFVRISGRETPLVFQIFNM